MPSEDSRIFVDVLEETVEVTEKPKLLGCYKADDKEEAFQAASMLYDYEFVEGNDRWVEIGRRE